MTNKLDSDTALAKIRVIISRYYEKKGRGDFNDSYCDIEELLDVIDDILEEVDIDPKKVIIEKLEFDEVFGSK